MRKLILVAALLGGVAATPAMAQDNGSARGRAHIEGVIGYDAPHGDVSDASGIVYGLGAGYDFFIGRNLTIGPDAEITTASTDECATGINRAGDQLCLDAGRDIYVGGRIGYRFGGNGQHLAYIGGGYTNARLHTTYDANLAGTTGDFDISDDEDGFRLKGGVEVGIGRNAFVRAEYRYSRYEDADLNRHQVVGAIGLRF
jgi:outer membrane immunogenic protein